MTFLLVTELRPSAVYFTQAPVEQTNPAQTSWRSQLVALQIRIVACDIQAHNFMLLLNEIATVASDVPNDLIFGVFYIHFNVAERAPSSEEHLQPNKLYEQYETRIWL